jgi:hypothetical protein
MYNNNNNNNNNNKGYKMIEVLANRPDIIIESKKDKNLLID